MNFSENESKIGLPTPLLKITFAAYVQDYITSLKNSDKHDHSIIHYLPKFKKPENYPIPTLPPTDLNFQNLRFVPGAEKDNNMLIYLQMVRRLRLSLAADMSLIRYIADGNKACALGASSAICEQYLSRIYLV